MAFERLKFKDDKKIKGLEEWIRTLEKQKFETERDYCRACDDLEHLRRAPEGRRGSPHLETHPRRNSNGGPSKRATTSKGMSHGERAP